VLVAGLNRRWWVADSRVEQSPEGEGVPGPASETAWLQVASVSCRRLRPVLADFGRWGREVERAVVGFDRCGAREVGNGSSKRQEGNVAGDSVRLHGRSKALKGATP
jgi:hypothetical protein